MRPELGFRALIVEDDPDIREALVEALEVEGYSVDKASTAEAGLDLIRASEFQLIVTDYNMPGGTGVWMLQEATKEGRISGTKVIVLTAEQNPQGTAGLKVLNKPLDLDVFLREVFDAFAVTRVRELEDGQASVSQHPSAGVRQFVLYVTEGSEACVRALHALQQAVLREDPSTIEIKVWDISKAPNPDQVGDAISLTPTLVRTAPLPTMRLISDLHEPDVLAAFLRGST